MRIPTIVCFLFGLALSCEPIEAQRKGIVFQPVYHPILQPHYIRHITIDRDGKLWLTTNEGLLRYDGNEVRFFDIGKDGGYRSFSGRNNDLYVAIPLGLNIVDTRTGAIRYVDIKVNSEDSSGHISFTSFTDILEDDDQSIWCGRYNMGLLHYNRVSQKAVSYQQQPSADKNSNTIRSIQKDPRNPDLLWLGTDNGIYSFNKKTLVFARNFKCISSNDSTIEDTKILKMHMNDRDTIWFITKRRGVGYYTTKDGYYKTYAIKQGHQSIEITNSDLLFFQPKNSKEFYIGSLNDYPGIFNTQTHDYVFNITSSKDYSGLNIDHVVADSLGNLWCTIFGQLFYANVQGHQFSVIPFSHLGRNNRLMNVLWDKNHYFIAFNRSPSVIVLDTNYNYKQSILFKKDGKTLFNTDEFELKDIAMDRNGLLWACGTALFVSDRLQKEMIPVQNLYPNLSLKGLHFQNIICKGNYLYLQPSSPSSGAIYRIDLISHTYDSIPIQLSILPNSGEEGVFGEKNGTMVIDRPGELAYVSLYDYLIQVNLVTKKCRKVTRIIRKESYELDDNNFLWVSSGSGIRVYEPAALRMIKKYTHEPGTDRFQMCNGEDVGTICLLNTKGVLLYDYKNSRQHQLSLSDGLISHVNYGISCVNKTLFVGAQFNALQYIPITPIINRNKKRKCYVSEIQLFNKTYKSDTLPEYINKLELPFDKNFLTFTFSSTEFDQAELIEYRYKLAGVDRDWVYTNHLNRTISYPDLRPNKYLLFLSVKNPDGSWTESTQTLSINIIPAWWQTMWFKIASLLALAILTLVIVRFRINSVRKQEKKKAVHEKELLELEAKALRAQMNPHFIFNCMNSIKALIQTDDKQKATDYLTTFSKLIRTLFQNSDKRQISLYDELETCKLYTRLEAMRLNGKLKYTFNIDPDIDLKSVMVPALIIQPFIENAIWHGIVPKDEGEIKVVVKTTGNVIICEVNDNGIGREMSKLNKPVTPVIHESKGVHLSQARLDLEKMLNETQASIETIDEYENAEPAGTRVIITFNLQ